MIEGENLKIESENKIDEIENLEEKEVKNIDPDFGIQNEEIDHKQNLINGIKSLKEKMDRKKISKIRAFFQ